MVTWYHLDFSPFFFGVIPLVLRWLHVGIALVIPMVYPGGLDVILAAMFRWPYVCLL